MGACAASAIAEVSSGVCELWGAAMEVEWRICVDGFDVQNESGTNISKPKNDTSFGLIHETVIL